MVREPQQVLDLIIRPITPLLMMGKPEFRDNQEFFMTYVGAVESGFDNLRQVLDSGNYGKGHGWWQMEPDTFDDNVNKLNEFPDLKETILKACCLDSMPGKDVMIWNIRFAYSMARFHFWRYPEPLPKKDDIEGMANYWLKYYNRGGKGTVERFVTIAKSLNLKQGVKALERILSFFKKNAQTIAVGIISFFLLYRPTIMTMYIVDYVVCCWALNCMINVAKRIYKRCLLK